MTYQEFIEFNRNKDQGKYTHIHHIVPKCKGGTNEKSNLIKLSWIAHYYAHMLLAKENPNDKDIQHEFNSKGDLGTWLSRCYKWSQPANEYTRQKASETHSGKDVSEETRRRISESHKGMKYSEERNRKISEFMKGNTYTKGHVLTDEHKKKLSEAITGKHWKLVDGKRVYY